MGTTNNLKINKLQLLCQRFGHLAIIKDVLKLDPKSEDIDDLATYLKNNVEITMSDLLPKINPLEAKIREIQAYVASQNLEGFKKGYLDILAKNGLELQKIVSNNFLTPFNVVYLAPIAGDCLTIENEGNIQLHADYLKFVNIGLASQQNKLVGIAQSFDTQVCDFLEAEFSEFQAFKPTDMPLVNPKLCQVFEQNPLSIDNKLLEGETVLTQSNGASFNTFLMTLRSPVMILIGLSMVSTYFLRASIPAIFTAFLANHPVLNIGLICALVNFALYKTLTTNTKVKRAIQIQRNQLATKIRENILRDLKLKEVLLQSAVTEHLQSFLQTELSSILAGKYQYFDKHVLAKQRQTANDLNLKVNDARKLYTDLGFLRQELTILTAM